MSRTPRSQQPLLRRMLSAPVSPRAIENRVRSRVHVPIGWVLALTLVALLVAVGSVLRHAWPEPPAELVARHRPEALCFALASPPVFDPPMRIEPSVAVVHSRLPFNTPPAIALQQLMGFPDEMVLSRSTSHVGDFDVAVLWLRMAGDIGPEYWLIACWMNDDDLEVCNFRFSGDGPELTDLQRQWGAQLLGRLLTPAHFRAAGWPDVRWQPRDGRTMPVYGPKT